MESFGYFFLDNEKDMIVNLFKEDERIFYALETPNHHSGNLIRNFARVCGLPLSLNKETGLREIRGEVPAYVDKDNQTVYLLRFGKIGVADLYPDGTIEQKVSVPAITKTLMSQTKDYRLDENKTVFRTYVRKEYKFHSDLHTHMNGNLSPDVLIALGVARQIRYPLYYIRKLNLTLSSRQEKELEEKRKKVAGQFADSGLTGKYLARKINDNTYINFADLILGNLKNADDNIVKIRISLAIMKDGQAVFTNLEKVYLYRYVFTKATESKNKIEIKGYEKLEDKDVKAALMQMLADRKSKAYKNNTLYQDTLLWIARGYRKQGITYAEISDTTLVKKYESLRMLEEVHEVMPKIYKETGVMLRFLAAIRRIPLTIVKDEKTPDDYLMQNLNVLRAVIADPYVAGSDFVGEEINDISLLAPLIKELVAIAKTEDGYVLRIHAGENDSLRDNVAHAIACVKRALAPGQEMPRMRIGHGIYTCSLRSAKGKQLLEDLRKYSVVLEFQLTSNVRLNNLTNLDKHPLHAYLEEGIQCVQGTDGAALYGTNAIDEQLSLETLLGLSDKELTAMREAEQKIMEEALASFYGKEKAFKKLLRGRPISDVLLEKMERCGEKKIRLNRRGGKDAYRELETRISELPWDAFPVVVCGGSFNAKERLTRLTDEGKREIDLLMETLSPDEAFFVIGHRISGYEKYLVEHNTKGFRIFSIVPARISELERKRIIAAHVQVRISTETEGWGIYKSFNYEIFERRPSVVVCFDGNSAADNLIQEAKNGKGLAHIYIWEKGTALRKKADSLEGYVYLFGKENGLAAQVDGIKKALFEDRGQNTDWYKENIT